MLLYDLCGLKKFPIILSFFVLIMLIPSQTFAVGEENEAQPQITDIKKGAVAPFDGTLFNRMASVKLITDLKLSPEVCQLKCEKELGFLRTEKQFEIDVAAARYTNCENEKKELLALKNSQIQFLRQHYEPLLWYEKPATILLTGMVVGILTTIAITHTVNDGN
jgi:hypothetical protein